MVTCPVVSTVRRGTAVALVLACAAVLLPAAASARVHVQWFAGTAASGTPARLDRVGALQVGAAKARNVLVLNPGTSVASAYMLPLAKSIVERAPGWQVWVVERRENLLKDESMLDRAKQGEATPKQVFDYYIGWLKWPSISPHLQPVTDAEAPYARGWGLATAVGDVRQVVRHAQRLGGKVVLGGHSLGGAITTAYATWDFNGRAGADGLSGLVFIDGASAGRPTTPAVARKGLQKLATGSPWLEFGGIPTPFAGLMEASGSTAVLTDPHGLSPAPEAGLAPPGLFPSYPVTNAGLYGYALDAATSPASLAAIQAHLGRLGPVADPRDWDGAGALTPLQRMADMFAGTGLRGMDGASWYHPERLSLDAGAIGNGIANPAQRVLGVRTTLGRRLPRDLRLLAFAAQLGGTPTLRATEALARQSHIPRSRVTLVDRHATYAHMDPVSAAPGRNAFLARLVPYLRGIAPR